MSDQSKRDFARGGSSNMRDGSPHESVRPSDIDPEQLAALLDGRLQGAERHAVVARLATSDDESALFAEAASVLGELTRDEAPRASSTISGRRARRWWRRSTPWLAAAAVLAAVIVTPLVWRRRASGNRVSDPALALFDQTAGLPASWAAPEWPVTRGEGAPLSASALAVRAGVAMTDLELRLAAHDSAAAGTARQLGRLLADTPGGGAAARLFNDIADSVRAEAWPSPSAVAAGHDALTTQLDEDYFIIGSWAEAARVAAARGDSAFFRSAATRAVLDRIRKLTAHDPRLVQPLERLRRALAAQALDVGAEHVITEILMDVGG